MNREGAEHAQGSLKQTGRQRDELEEFLGPSNRFQYIFATCFASNGLKNFTEKHKGWPG